MKVLKSLGYAPQVQPTAAGALPYRVAAYYAVPLDVAALKAAIYQYGPITVGGRWFNSWFKPRSGILPAPSGGVAGGHEVLLFGWDDDVASGSLLLRNSWGGDWGVNGNAYAPYRLYVPNLWEAWKALDVVTSGPR